MKKTIFAAFLLCALLLTGCGGDETENDIKPEATEVALSAGDCFKVSEERSNGVTRYSYSVTSKNGETLESALCAEQPQVAVINPDLLGIRFTSDDRVFCRYYDLKNGFVSESFFNAFWDNGKLVAYYNYDNGHRMVVRSIFDHGSYYYQTEIDCPSLELTVTSCELNEQTGELTVSYVYGAYNTKGTVKLPTLASN